MSNLELTVDNIKKEQGQLLISIYNKASDFPIDGKEFKLIIVETINKAGTTINVDLQNGEYAIALLHDVNSDGECNFNFIGIPTEGYGFSKNVRPILKAPNFEETKFHLNENTSMKINLIH